MRALIQGEPVDLRQSPVSSTSSVVLRSLEKVQLGTRKVAQMSLWLLSDAQLSSKGFSASPTAVMTRLCPFRDNLDY